MTSAAPLRLGTRGSALATTQSQLVADELARVSGRDVELVHVRTHGDVSTAPLSTIGGTGVFAAALREALAAGGCDLAVHSLKDLPVLPAPGLVVAATPPRADVRDALCARDGRTLEALPHGARVGTGSPRRAAQLRALRPDLQVVDVRGNVGTRLARIEDDLDAVVLAAAGLDRLGLSDAVTDLFDPSVLLPAPGQGSLAVEIREDAATTVPGLVEALAELDDAATRAAVTAERTLLGALEAGCTAPIGAWARPGADGGLVLDAVVVSADGTRQLRATATGTDAGAADLGRTVAADLLERGAAELVGA